MSKLKVSVTGRVPNDDDLRNLKNYLISGITYVKFLLVNGGTTSKICTQCPELIPESNRPKVTSNTAPSKASSTTIPIFDLESQTWKSLRKDHLIEFDVAYYTEDNGYYRK